MSSSSGILSQTLQTITKTKMEEIVKQQQTFETRKSDILKSANDTTDQRARLHVLLSGIVGLSTTTYLDEFEDHELDSATTGGLSLKNIRRFLDQSRYDPSVPASLLQEWERRLRLLLDQRTRKLEYADLYARLLTEWLSDTSSASTPPAASTSDSASLDGPFELVAQTKLQQLREMFESYVFEPLDTDIGAINDHLDGLFAGKAAAKALKELREQVKEAGDALVSTSNPFDEHALRWCINGLLKNELLTEQKKTLLGEFLQNKVVLTEIADVLNMRFANLQGWSWGSDGILVQPRRQLNGKYRVMMDEDILEAIFLHYIGIVWSVRMKHVLKRLVSNKAVWKSSQEPMPREELYRRKYYLGKLGTDVKQGIAFEKQETYENDFFLAQLPNTVQAGARGGYDNEDDDAPDQNVKTPLQIRQQLLHQLGAELLIHQSLHGEVAVVQSDIQWFYTSLSHSTIYAVLRYFGMPESWIYFFRVYLETPLRMVCEGQQESERRTRRRGVPIAHAISNFMAEVVLFVLDLAVNHEARGTLLYRLTDDLWIWGDPALCKDAWKAVRHSVEILGLTINEKKSGSFSPERPGASEANALPKGDVTWGFLKLEAGTGRWIIDQSQVDRHTKQLKRQLAASKSVFSFIQLWNSCVGRFFKRTFGEPANCFGRGHVDMILDTHKRIQSQLFDESGVPGNSVTDHLRKIIAERFGVTDVSDGFLYLPEELGGLALCNPFIDYLGVRDELIKSPERPMEQFFEDEKETYREACERFDANGGYGQTLPSAKGLPAYARPQNVSDPVAPGGDQDRKKFMSMTEFIQYRELTSLDLKLKYNLLCAKPSPSILDSTADVYAAVERLPSSQRNILESTIDAESSWLISLCAPDLLQRFGGLNIVDKGLLPLGVMQMLRSNKVTWQEVL